ncbi:MAG: hypothetical protein C0478_06735 [Planctomyces sp.]|nr:hypothetical protein [Planctomyces sp.]
MKPRRTQRKRRRIEGELSSLAKPFVKGEIMTKSITFVGNEFDLMDRDSVAVPAIVDGEKVCCWISEEAIRQHVRDCKGLYLLAFQNHRALFHQVISDVIQRSTPRNGVYRIDKTDDPDQGVCGAGSSSLRDSGVADALLLEVRA